MNVDSSDRLTLVNNLSGTPNILTVDRERRQIYWTNMGAKFGDNDRFIDRCDLLFDDRDRTLYGTNRGLTPRGNTRNAARVGATGLTGQRNLLMGLWEGIGVCASARRDALFVTELVLGHVRRFDLASGKARTIRRGWLA